MIETEDGPLLHELHEFNLLLYKFSRIIFTNFIDNTSTSTMAIHLDYVFHVFTPVCVRLLRFFIMAGTAAGTVVFV